MWYRCVYSQQGSRKEKGSCCHTCTTAGGSTGTGALGKRRRRTEAVTCVEGDVDDESEVRVDRTGGVGISSARSVRIR